MTEDARAKIRLADGREVWRMVSVSYREVGSGRWVSANEVEGGSLAGIAAKLPVGKLTENAPEEVRKKIVDAQVEIALDRQGGPGSPTRPGWY